ncbi:MAG: FHA domain-containing protein [Bradymonadia bacterium]
MADQNRKTLRSFYCRDYLWELFEVMTRDLGCSMDYLINESMRHYARSRNYSLSSQRTGAPEATPQPQHGGYPQPHHQTPAPQPQQRRRPPPIPGQETPQVAHHHRPTLYLLFNGQRYRCDTDRFVIGRGTQGTDLTIRDGNISRKHAAVIFRNGSYFIKDLDSTNGIEYNGKRIEHKRIEEGDTVYLCDYEIRFTFH